MNRLSIDPRPPVNQGIDSNNVTVLRHTAIYNSLLSHVTEGSGNVYWSVNPYGTAPLTGCVGVWAVNLNPIIVEISDDIGSIPVRYGYTPDAIGANLVPVLGMAPDAANQIRITIPGVGTASTTYITNPLPLTDADIPADPNIEQFTGFPICEVTIEDSNPPDIINELYFIAVITRYNVGYDSTGRVRWYTTLDIPAYTFQRLANGHFISTASNFDVQRLLYEFDMMGRVHNVYVLDNSCHHSIYQLPDGNILMPSEYTGTTSEDGISIMDINTGLEIAYYDMRNVMDTVRTPVPRNTNTLDWLHINQSYLNTTNNLIVNSARHQGVFAIDADSSELVFILANHEGWGTDFQQYLLTPIDDTGAPLYDLTNQDDIDKADKEFWSWGQHAVFEIPNANQGIVEILLFDNGNFRSRDEAKALIPNDNHSRMVHYRVNINDMTVVKIFEYGETEVGNRGYSSYVCNVQTLDSGNYLMNFGGIVFDENGRRRSIEMGYADIIDPLVGEMAQGMVILQEIDPNTKQPRLELTCTSGRYKSPETDGSIYEFDVSSFRALKLRLLP